jgi:hypothetical protein
MLSSLPDLQKERGFPYASRRKKLLKLKRESARLPYPPSRCIPKWQRGGYTRGLYVLIGQLAVSTACLKDNRPHTSQRTR